MGKRPSCPRSGIRTLRTISGVGQLSKATIHCLVQFGDEGSDSGGMVVRLPDELGYEEYQGSVASRLARAVEWVLDLETQYSELIEAGQKPKISIPGIAKKSVGRVRQESAAEYNRLRMSIAELIRPILLDPPPLQPLFPFQRRGVEWLLEKSGGILADDMGLGKTVQVISAIRILFNRAEIRSVLVLCPKNLISTWEREFERWAPEIGVVALTSSGSARAQAWKSVYGHCHVIITNYEQIRTPPEPLIKRPPDLVVADEAHWLRNVEAQITRGSFQLNPKRLWALTGTPVERDLEDLATLLSLIAPKEFAPSDAKLHPSSLRSQARPYILRRQRKDVLKDLPEVVDSLELIELTKVQDDAYGRAIREWRSNAGDKNELALGTRLLTLCDMEPDSKESSKANRILEHLKSIHAKSEKAIVFSTRIAPLHELQIRISDRWGPDACCLFIGELDSDQREEAISRFRSEKNTFVLLASMRVGSEGLTLTEANHVFMFSQWWNPSSNDQARDRVVRIGQRRMVRVYRLCCRGTIEESLEEILKSKRKLVEVAVDRMAEVQADDLSDVIQQIGIRRLIEDYEQVT